MSDSYQIKDQSGIYFLTFQVINWMDVFTRKNYRDIIIDSFNFCQKNKGLNIHAYVFMSNHIHCILSAKEDNLSAIIRDFKTFTSKSIIEAIDSKEESRRTWMLGQMIYFAKSNKRNSLHQFWTQENHAVELTTNKFMDQKLEYIHQNSVRAGIVDEPEHYIYCSAVNYAGRKGLIEIAFME